MPCWIVGIRRCGDVGARHERPGRAHEGISRCHPAPGLHGCAELSVARIADDDGQLASRARVLAVHRAIQLNERSRVIDFRARIGQRRQSAVRRYRQEAADVRPVAVAGEHLLVEQVGALRRQVGSQKFLEPEQAGAILSADDVLRLDALRRQA